MATDYWARAGGWGLNKADLLLSPDLLLASAASESPRRNAGPSAAARAAARQQNAYLFTGPATLDLVERVLEYLHLQHITV